MSPALLAVASPGDQISPAGRKVRLQVRSVDMTTGAIAGTLAGPAGSSQVTITVSAAGATPVIVTFTWHVHD